MREIKGTWICFSWLSKLFTYFSTRLRIFLGIFVFLYNFKLQKKLKEQCIKASVYLWFQFTNFVIIFFNWCIFYKVSSIMPHDLYILGKRVFLTYLNQEVQCWYDTIIWILIPYSYSICPYSVPFGVSSPIQDHTLHWVLRSS